MRPLLAAFAWMPVLALASAEADPVHSSVLKVLVTFQTEDPILPWRKLPPSKRQGYAVAIASHQLLTTERLIRNATLVEVLRAQRAEKIPARVAACDEQANLAVLSLEEGARTGSHVLPLHPVRRMEGPETNRTVRFVQFDETDALQQGTGEIIQRYVGPLPDGHAYSLLFKVLTEFHINGEGAAVLQEDRLVGLVMSYDRNSRMAEILPWPIVNQFLHDVETPPYEGFGSAGFLWDPLVDPAKRAYLGVHASGKGILVRTCLPTGTAEPPALKPNDVILVWDGHALDNLGFYDDSEFGRLRFPYLIRGRRKPGDRVQVTIVRDRQTQQIEVPIRRFRDEDCLIPENIEARPEAYLVSAGCVLRELTGRYLRGRGPNWHHHTDPRLLHVYFTRRLHPAAPGDRIVILSMVLPDVLNVGYQSFHDLLVTHVNGQPVRNLQEVCRIVDADGGLQRLHVVSSDVPLVFDARETEAADARVRQQYRIPNLRQGWGK